MWYQYTQTKKVECCPNATFLQTICRIFQAQGQLNNIPCL